MSESPTSVNAPPPKAFQSHVVKIVLPEGRGAAVIYNKDRTIFMEHPVGLLQKRFAPGERVGFFRGELDADGILEIGDRVPDREW